MIVFDLHGLPYVQILAPPLLPTNMSPSPLCTSVVSNYGIKVKHRHNRHMHCKRRALGSWNQILVQN